MHKQKNFSKITKFSWKKAERSNSSLELNPQKTVFSGLHRVWNMSNSESGKRKAAEGTGSVSYNSKKQLKCWKEKEKDREGNRATDTWGRKSDGLKRNETIFSDNCNQSDQSLKELQSGTSKNHLKNAPKRKKMLWVAFLSLHGLFPQNSEAPPPAGELV